MTIPEQRCRDHTHDGCAGRFGVPAFASLMRLYIYEHPIKIDHGQIALRFGDNDKPSLRGRLLHVRPLETADGQASEGLQWVLSV